MRGTQQSSNHVRDLALYTETAQTRDARSVARITIDTEDATTHRYCIEDILGNRDRHLAWYEWGTRLQYGNCQFPVLFDEVIRLLTEDWKTDCSATSQLANGRYR